ncbi:Hsp20/alpha crystallin family protein [Candidatus Methylocalor cossyra]|uniref:HSP20 family molecular chaperone IbpA n=1 Tax=Candidatus Methylocalor cossyra TaxID=3108543 RepID=A0ABM9NGI6_9GAMM
MPRDPTTWMWAQACEMLEQAERLHRRFFHLHRIVASRPVWEPPVDIVETKDHLKITLVVPGVPPEAIDIAAVGDLLIVSGEKPLGVDPEAAVIHRLEIPYGRFERQIRLPAGRFRIGEPSCAHGCLTLLLQRLD